MTDLFMSFYASHYEKRSKYVYLLPLFLIVVFIFTLYFLSFTKTDKVFVTSGTIVPSRHYRASLSKRGFVNDNYVQIGRFFDKGDVLVSMRLDDGSVTNILSPHRGVVVDSALKIMTDGPLIEGTNIATLADPDEFVLKVKVPPKLRGVLRNNGRVLYKFDTFSKSIHSNIVNFEAGLDGNNDVYYTADVLLSSQYKQALFIGRGVSVKLLIQDISLFDYFLNF